MSRPALSSSATAVRLRERSRGGGEAPGLVLEHMGFDGEDWVEPPPWPWPCGGGACPEEAL